MQNVMDAAIELSIEGMTCGGCANAVTRALAKVPGVTAVTVDRPGGRGRVEGNADARDLIAAVEQAGFGARLAQGTAAESGHGHGACGCGH